MATPIYIIEETKLRRNLQLIADIAAKADIEVILAFKAFALWKTFPIFREYIYSTTASSLSEARLALPIPIRQPIPTMSSRRLWHARHISRSTRCRSTSIFTSVRQVYH